MRQPTTCDSMSKHINKRYEKEIYKNSLNQKIIQRQVLDFNIRLTCDVHGTVTAEDTWKKKKKVGNI